MVRAARAGAMSAVLVSGYWLVTESWLSHQDCRSRSTNPYPCLGAGILVVLIGIPLLMLLVALILVGRGFLHAVLGAIVSVGLGTIAVYEVLDVIDYGGDDAIGWALTGPAVGLVAAVWSVRAPGRPHAA